MPLPTLLRCGMFEFPAKTELTDAEKRMLKDNKAVDIVCKILSDKLSGTGIQKRVYLLKAFTASGKTTVFPVEALKQIASKVDRAVFVSEPRIVLCSNAINDIMNNNSNMRLGTELTIHTSVANIRSHEKSYITFATVQILQDYLNRVIAADEAGNRSLALSLLRRYAIIMVDEAHILELPTMSAVRSIRHILTSYGNEPICPLFVFASATLMDDAFIEYFELGSSLKYTLGTVRGIPNYPIIENYLTDEQVRRLNNKEGIHLDIKTPPKMEVEPKRLLGGAHVDLLALYKDFDKLDFQYRPITLLGGKSFEKPFDPFQSLGKLIGRQVLPLAMKSQSFVDIIDNNAKGRFQCRDILVFVPTTMTAETAARNLGFTLEDSRKRYFVLQRQTNRQQLQKWRSTNEGKERYLIMPYSAEFSALALEILDKPYEDDEDVLKNETKVIFSTNVIEAGKTLTMLYICIDTGLNMTNVFCPLVFEHTRGMPPTLKKLPERLNQMIQRRGRVGRNASGIYIGTYSERCKAVFDKNDVPETVNSGCLSEQLYAIVLEPLSKRSTVDMKDYNDFLIPVPLDLLIRSCRDLFYGNLLGSHGEYMLQKAPERWKLYAILAYYLLKMPLFRALVTASINRYKLPTGFEITDFDASIFQHTIESAVETGYKKAAQFIPEARWAFNDIVEGRSKLIVPFRNDFY